MKTSQYLLDTSREYAIYVCSTRAIPNVQDGLKHGQRIALWLLRNRAEKLKTYALSGLMGYERLYVHGEGSANNAISLLAAPYKNNVPMIEGLGAFGSRVAPVEGIGAPRYTEVRRAKSAESILYRDLDLVPLVDNYDGSSKQPEHFLPLIPVVLLNGVSGVAVGWSTEILPRSLKSLIDATIAALDGKPVPQLDPKFERYNLKIVRLGSNSFEFRGHVDIVDTSTITVTELPPGVAIESFRKRLIEMEDDERIQSFTDRSTDSINISIKLKRGAAKGWKEDDAVEFLKLRERVTERLVTINWDGRSIRTWPTAEDLVKEFAEWRLGWYSKRFEKQVADAEEERSYWRVIKALFDAGFTKKLGTFADRGAMEDEVTAVATKAKLKIVDGQMDRITSLPTYRWTVAFRDEVVAKIKALDESIADWKATLASPKRLKDVYRGELEELRKIK